jgi:hypothetical protein
MQPDFREHHPARTNTLKMKILYNQTQLKRTLIMGIAFTAIGVLSIFFSTEHFLAGFVGIGILYIAISIVQKNRAYVVISDEYIQKDGIIKQKLSIAQIQSVKYFAGDYIIKSSAKELTIDTNVVDKKYLPELQQYFERYSIVKV